MNYFTRYGVVVSPQQGLRVLAGENVICNVSRHITTTNRMQLCNPWQDILSPP